MLSLNEVCVQFFVIKSATIFLHSSKLQLCIGAVLCGSMKTLVTLFCALCWITLCILM